MRTRHDYFAQFVGGDRGIHRLIVSCADVGDRPDPMAIGARAQHRLQRSGAEYGATDLAVGSGLHDALPKSVEQL